MANELSQQKDKWLQQAVQSGSILGDPLVRRRFSDLIGTGNNTGRINSDPYGTGISLFEQASYADYSLNKQRMEAGDDPEKLKAYYEAQSKTVAIDATFFLAIAKRERNVALDLTKAMEERQAAGERFKTAMGAYYDAMNESLQIEADKQKEAQAQMDANKAAQEKLTGDILGTLLTTLGERRKDAAGNIVVVPVNGVQDLGAALQNAMKGLDPATASAITQIIKNNVPSKIGGYFDS